MPKPHKHMVPEPKLKSRVPKCHTFPHSTFLSSLIEVEPPGLVSVLGDPGAQMLATPGSGLCDRALGGDVPPLSPQLHRLCWSLRDSQEVRVDLDEEIQVKKPTPQAQPGEKEEPNPAGGPI